MRVLIMAYTYPPVAGMTPRRLAEMVKALHRRGHKTVVVTADQPPRYPIDLGSDADLPADSQVHRISPRPGYQPPKDEETAARKTGSTSRWVDFYRHWLKSLVYPDSTFPWIRPAVAKGIELCRAEEFDIVYSFAYPYSAHVVGDRIARAAGIPWVADYGDPWCFNPMWDVHSLRRRFDRRVESKLVARAAGIAVTTPETQQAYESEFEAQPRLGVRVATCGYDAELLDKVTPAPRTQEVRIVYAGIYGQDNRDLSLILEALSRLRDLEWEFVIAGRDLAPPGKRVEDVARSLNMSDRIDERGHVPLADSLSLQKSADLLVMWGWPGGLQVPAKIYEYLAMGARILVVRGDEDDPSAKLLERVGSGSSAAANVDEVTQSLREEIERGPRDTENSCVPESAKPYAWSVQAGYLVDLLEEAAR